jgi:hypothetical protein
MTFLMRISPYALVKNRKKITVKQPQKHIINTSIRAIFEKYPFLGFEPLF